MEASLTLESLSFSFRNCSEEKFSLHSNLPLESQKILSVLIQNLQQKHQKVTVHGCKLVRFVGQEGQISAKTTSRKARDKVERMHQDSNALKEDVPLSRFLFFEYCANI